MTTKALISYYGKDYYTKQPYPCYQDFPRHDEVFRRVMLMMNPRSVLDVGCAYGYMVKRFQGIGLLSVGVDLSAWCGQQRIIPGCYVMASADQLPFKDQSFDLLFCEGVLEHLPEESVAAVMNEFERVAIRRLLALSYNHPECEDGHVCNHDFAWWYDQVPPTTMLGVSGRSIDAERIWAFKC